MSLLPRQERKTNSIVSELVRERVQGLTGTPLQRSFLVEDVLIKRDSNPETSLLSFQLKRSDTSTGNFQVRENCQNLMKVRWESKGIQGLLNLLNQTIVLEEEISVESEFQQTMDQLKDENQKLRKEVSLLRQRLGDAERIILQ
jgi:hypothetical protein